MSKKAQDNKKLLSSTKVFVRQRRNVFQNFENPKGYESQQAQIKADKQYRKIDRNANQIQNEKNQKQTEREQIKKQANGDLTQHQIQLRQTKLQSLQLQNLLTLYNLRNNLQGISDQLDQELKDPNGSDKESENTQGLNYNENGQASIHRLQYIYNYLKYQQNVEKLLNNTQEIDPPKIMHLHSLETQLDDQSGVDAPNEVLEDPITQQDQLIQASDKLRKQVNQKNSTTSTDQIQAYSGDSIRDQNQERSLQGEEEKSLNIFQQGSQEEGSLDDIAMAASEIMTDQNYQNDQNWISNVKRPQLSKVPVAIKDEQKRKKGKKDQVVPLDGSLGKDGVKIFGSNEKYHTLKNVDLEDEYMAVYQDNISQKPQQETKDLEKKKKKSIPKQEINTFQERETINYNELIQDLRDRMRKQQGFDQDLINQIEGYNKQQDKEEKEVEKQKDLQAQNTIQISKSLDMDASNIRTLINIEETRFYKGEQKLIAKQLRQIADFMGDKKFMQKDYDQNQIFQALLKQKYLYLQRNMSNLKKLKDLDNQLQQYYYQQLNQKGQNADFSNQQQKDLNQEKEQYNKQLDIQEQKASQAQVDQEIRYYDQDLQQALNMDNFKQQRQHQNLLQGEEKRMRDSDILQQGKETSSVQEPHLEADYNQIKDNSQVLQNDMLNSISKKKQENNIQSKQPQKTQLEQSSQQELLQEGEQKTEFEKGNLKEMDKQTSKFESSGKNDKLQDKDIQQSQNKQQKNLDAHKQNTLQKQQQQDEQQLKDNVKQQKSQEEQTTQDLQSQDSISPISNPKDTREQEGMLQFLNGNGNSLLQKEAQALAQDQPRNHSQIQDRSQKMKKQSDIEKELQAKLIAQEKQEEEERQKYFRNKVFYSAVQISQDSAVLVKKFNKLLEQKGNEAGNNLAKRQRALYQYKMNFKDILAQSMDTFQVADKDLSYRVIFEQVQKDILNERLEAEQEAKELDENRKKEQRLIKDKQVQEQMRLKQQEQERQLAIKRQLQQQRYLEMKAKEQENKMTWEEYEELREQQRYQNLLNRQKIEVSDYVIGQQEYIFNIKASFIEDDCSFFLRQAKKHRQNQEQVEPNEKKAAVELNKNLQWEGFSKQVGKHQQLEFLNPPINEMFEDYVLLMAFINTRPEVVRTQYDGWISNRVPYYKIIHELAFHPNIPERIHEQYRAINNYNVPKYQDKPGQGPVKVYQSLEEQDQQNRLYRRIRFSPQGIATIVRDYLEIEENNQRLAEQWGYQNFKGQNYDRIIDISQTHLMAQFIKQNRIENPSKIGELQDEGLQELEQALALHKLNYGGVQGQQNQSTTILESSIQIGPQTATFAQQQDDDNVFSQQAIDQAISSNQGTQPVQPVYNAQIEQDLNNQNGQQNQQNANVQNRAPLSRDEMPHNLQNGENQQDINGVQDQDNQKPEFTYQDLNYEPGFGLEDDFDEEPWSDQYYGWQYIDIDSLKIDNQIEIYNKEKQILTWDLNLENGYAIRQLPFKQLQNGNNFFSNQNGTSQDSKLNKVTLQGSLNQYVNRPTFIFEGGFGITEEDIKLQKLKAYKDVTQTQSMVQSTQTPEPLFYYQGKFIQDFGQIQRFLDWNLSDDKYDQDRKSLLESEE